MRSPPHLAATRRRWRRVAWALDAALFLGVFAFAASVRLRGLPAAPLLADQVSHLRSAHEILSAVPLRQPPYYYTSLYLLLMAGFQAAFPSPLLGLQAWTATGGLTAALAAVALRRVAGLPAAIAGAGILALLPVELFVHTGIKSPYFLSVFVSVALLGLAGIQARSPWGPPLLALGCTSSVAMHLGMWPMGFAGVALALGAATVPVGGAGFRRAARVAARAAITLGPTLSLMAWLWIWDGQRLLLEVRRISRGSLPTPPQPRQWREIVDPVLAMPAELQQRLLAAGLLGGVGFLAWSAASRTGPGGRLTTVEQRDAGRTALLALGLAVAGGAAYAQLWHRTAYLEQHHLVGLPPLLVMALAGFGAQLVPGRPRWLPMLASATLLAPWLGAVHQASLRLAPWDWSQLRPDQLEDTFRLAAPIQAAARASGRTPLVVSWLPATPDEPQQIRTEVVAEVALWGARTAAGPPSCWLLTRPGVLDLAPHHVVGDYAAYADTDCTWLPEQARTLCAASQAGEPSWLLRRRKPALDDPDDTLHQLFPCATAERSVRR
ncbi:hypothetical protein L6R53_04250 [Myxococcota bacterium]|nr:hypothetical protein [Myxococcota bacterium]